MKLKPNVKTRQIKSLVVIFFLLYIVTAIFTVYFMEVIDSSNETFDFQEIEQYLMGTVNAMKDMHPPKVNSNVVEILSFEFAAFFICAIYQIISQGNYMLGKEYGTARWGNREDRKQIAAKDDDENMILTQTERINLNVRKINKNLNVLVVGGSGSGKSRFFVKPNLLQANTSFVITDPKGELLRDTGHFLMTQGYTIKVFNLIDPLKSLKYNFFAYIRKESDILKLIQLLMKNTNGDKNGGDPFWEKAETALLQAIFFYIYFELNAREHHLKTVFTILRLAEVREEDEAFQSEFDFLFESLREKKPDHIAVKQYDIFKMAAGKTAKSILVSAGVRLAPFSISDIETLLSKDELNLSKLGDEKTALFVIVPDSDTTFNFIAGMMYTQLFDSLYYVADFMNHGSLKHHVRLMLDEFANIGKIPDFDKLIATMRSRNISVSVIIQNMSQLKSMYNKNWESIVGNCDSILYLGGNEQSTHEWVNKALGKMTIDTKNSSLSRGKNGSTSVNYGIHGRELMTVDELARMPNENCILLVRGMHPFYSKKFNLEKHKNYKYLYDANQSCYFNSEIVLEYINRFGVDKNRL